MMDLSDGLLKDGRRLAIASAVSLDFERDALIKDAEKLELLATKLGKDPFEWVLGGGEDHGLLATFPPEAQLPSGFRPVGVVLPREVGNMSEVVTLDGQSSTVASGYDHFEG
jgi:thiamine-monophosphate kinase